MAKYFLILIALVVFNGLNAQVLTGFSTRYNNDFVQWEVYADSIEEKGNLVMTWQQPDDWSQWNYRLGEKTGIIKTKWINDFSQWEIRGDNKAITARMIWQGDPTNWRITDNNFSIELTTKWGRQNVQEWQVEDAKRGRMAIFTEYRNDPRDWIVEDELENSVSLPMKMAILFIAMFNSVPKD